MASNSSSSSSSSAAAGTRANASNKRAVDTSSAPLVSQEPSGQRPRLGEIEDDGDEELGHQQMETSNLSMTARAQAALALKKLAAQSKAVRSIDTCSRWFLKFIKFLKFASLTG